MVVYHSKRSEKALKLILDIELLRQSLDDHDSHQKLLEIAKAEMDQFLAEAHKEYHDHKANVAKKLALDLGVTRRSRLLADWFIRS